MPRRSRVAAKAGSSCQRTSFGSASPLSDIRATFPPWRDFGATAAETDNRRTPIACRTCYAAHASTKISPHCRGSRSGLWFALMVQTVGDKRFVYVLRTADQDPHFYVGLTSNAYARLADHNAGRCSHTASRRPWQLHVVLEFPDEQRALRFERYLKSGSGRAFTKRHFEP
jgi:putative endonuclease